MQFRTTEEQKIIISKHLESLGFTIDVQETKEEENDFSIIFKVYKKRELQFFGQLILLDYSSLEKVLGEERFTQGTINIFRQVNPSHTYPNILFYFPDADDWKKDLTDIFLKKDRNKDRNIDACLFARDKCNGYDPIVFVSEFYKNSLYKNKLKSLLPTQLEKA